MPSPAPITINSKMVSVNEALTLWVRSFPNPVTKQAAITRLDDALKLGRRVNPNFEGTRTHTTRDAITNAMLAALSLRAQWSRKPDSYSVPRGGPEYTALVKAGSKIFVEAAGMIGEVEIRMQAVKEIPKYMAESATALARNVKEGLTPSFVTKGMLIGGGAILVYLLVKR